LKCWPEFFKPTLSGKKRFELRRDDRGGFQVGDELWLREWDPQPYGPTGVGFVHDSDAQPKGYTGREVLVRVDYVMPAETIKRLTGELGPEVLTKEGEWPTKPLQISGGYVIMSVSLVN
jgi:hypothetical protein